MTLPAIGFEQFLVVYAVLFTMFGAGLKTCYDEIQYYRREGEWQ